MFNIMKNLISRKYYETKEEAQEKVDVFFARKRITADEYFELTDLIEETYK